MYTKPTRGAIPFRDNPLMRGLVGWWLMNEGIGENVHDISGNNNPGTLTNMDGATDWVAGNRGHALDFDGSNDHVLIGGSRTYMTSGEPFSVSLWVKARSTINSFQHAVSLKQASGTPWRILWSNNGAYQLGFGAASTFARAKGTKPSDDEWHHIVVTYNGGPALTLSNFAMYADGVSVSLLAAGTYGAATNTSAIGFTVGGSSTQYWKGLIDDVRVYDRDLSLAEVRLLRSSSFDMFYSPSPGRISVSVAAAGGRIMSSLAGRGGLAGEGGIAGMGGGLAA